MYWTGLVVVVVGKWWREEMRCYQHQVDGAPALEHGGRGERARVGNTHAHASTRELVLCVCVCVSKWLNNNKLRELEGEMCAPE